jgi:hypothetical protein
MVRVTLFSIDDFTSNFIEINGNSSPFYVVDCYRRHYDTQINEIIKITNKINPFDLPRFWFIDADEVVRDAEDVKSINEVVGGGADDDEDELGKKCAIVLED